jgi:hypothetical protein
MKFYRNKNPDLTDINRMSRVLHIAIISGHLRGAPQEEGGQDVVQKKVYHHAIKIKLMFRRNKKPDQSTTNTMNCMLQ